MSEDNYSENDPEKTLITLDQLSQTIEVMTSVVNRLREHLSEQIKAQVLKTSSESEGQQQPVEAKNQTGKLKTENSAEKKESVIVEISQQDTSSVRKNPKVLH